MDKGLPQIKTADEITDMLFHSASKVQGKKGNAIEAVRSRAIKKLHRIAEKADRELSSYVTGFPSLMEGSFAYEMADIISGASRIKKSISSVHGCRNNIVSIANRTARAIAKSSDAQEIHRLRDQAYGRIASMLRGIDPQLRFLRAAATSLREIPDAKPGIVIAGFPNVGKSMLMTKLSNARTKVDIYPFTTKTVIPGRMKGSEEIVFDAPGLTPGGLLTTNAYERKSVAAIKHLARVLVFLVDASGTCGYTVQDQLVLYEKLKELVSPRPALLVYSKVDLYEPPGPGVSALTGKGMDELVSIIDKALHSVNYQNK